MRFRVLVLAAVSAALALGAGSAENERQPWLQEVHLLILPDEEALFRGLADPADREEFERIFWARRDPDPATPVNEFQEAVARRRVRADQLFEVPGRKGRETDCGQVVALLGEPQEVGGRELKVQFDSLPVMREGARRPEVWIYRSRPGDPVGLTGGELRMAFDADCRFSEGSRVLEDIRRVAQSKVVQPGLNYRKRTDGHLELLGDLARSEGRSRRFLESSRNDFPIAIDPKLLLRTQRGQAYVAGLVRVTTIPAANAAPPSSFDGAVVTQAVDASGRATPLVERPFRAAMGPDGTVTAAYEMTLAPGSYTLRVGVIAGEKDAATTIPLEVPDLGAAGLKLGSLLVYPPAATAGASGGGSPATITVGALRLEPRFGNVFSKTDALQAVCPIYGGQQDAVGKASLRAHFSFLKDGKTVAQGEDETFDTPAAVASVGPVPLAGFAPGRYVVRMEATDTVARKKEIRETPFEIKE